MFLFCNEDKKKKERLNSVLKTTHNLIKKNDIKDVRKNPVYSLIRAMSNYHLYDIVRELYEDEEVTDVQSIYKDIGEYLINSDKLNNSKSFELGESNINIDLSKDAILVCAWNKERFVNALLNIGQNVGNLFEYDKINHMTTYIYPIGLTIVYNGNHSTLHSLQRITRIVFSSMLAIMESVAGSYIPNRKLRLLFMTVSFPQIFCTIQQVDNSCKHISVFDM